MARGWAAGLKWEEMRGNGSECLYWSCFEGEVDAIWRSKRTHTKLGWMEWGRRCCSPVEVLPDNGQSDDGHRSRSRYNKRDRHPKKMVELGRRSRNSETAPVGEAGSPEGGHARGHSRLHFQTITSRAAATAARPFVGSKRRMVDVLATMPFGELLSSKTQPY